MRRTAFAAALLMACLAGALPGGAAAQRVSPDGVVYGQSWNLPQDLSNLKAMQETHSSGARSDRAARAARQAQFNQHFPGTPMPRTASR